MSVRTRTAKTRRINLRASEQQEAMLRTVAQRRGATLTDFILQSACDVAEQELASERDFRLPEDRWRSFVEALDAPPRAHARLQRLLSEPGVTEPSAGQT